MDTDATFFKKRVIWFYIARIKVPFVVYHQATRNIQRY